MLYNVAATLASIPAGRIGDARGSTRVLIAGAACCALACAGFAATDAGVARLAACFIAAGVAIGCVETAEHAAVAGRASEPLRGSAFGLLAAVQSLGNLIASGVAGLLYTVASPAAAFAFAAVVMAVATVTLTLTTSSGSTFAGG